MPRAKSTTPATRTTTPAPSKVTGLDETTILLAAAALAGGGAIVIGWAAYGEIMGRQADVLGVDIETTAEGKLVNVRWAADEVENAKQDVAAVTEAVIRHEDSAVYQRTLADDSDPTAHGAYTEVTETPDVKDYAHSWNA